MGYSNERSFKKKALDKLKSTANNGRGLDKLIATRKLAEIALNKAEFALLMHDHKLDMIAWQKTAVDTGELPF